MFGYSVNIPRASRKKIALLIIHVPKYLGGTLLLFSSCWNWWTESKLFFSLTQIKSCEDLLGRILFVFDHFQFFCLYRIVLKQNGVVAQELAKLNSSAIVFLWKAVYTKLFAGERVTMAHGFFMIVCFPFFSVGSFDLYICSRY